MQSSPETQRGFSLLELALTLALMALTASVLGPRLLNVDAYAEAAFFHEVLAAGQFAHRRAISSECTVEFRLDSNEVSLWRNASCDPAGPFDQAVRDPASPQQAYNRPSPISIAIPTRTIRYAATGQALNTSNQPTDFSFSIDGQAIEIDGATGWTRKEP